MRTNPVARIFLFVGLQPHTKTWSFSEGRAEVEREDSVPQTSSHHKAELQGRLVSVHERLLMVQRGAGLGHPHPSRLPLLFLGFPRPLQPVGQV